MDNNLQNLWQTGEKPFHGETIYPVDVVYVKDAIVVIQSALDHIARHYSSDRLFAFDDWHEHDGIVLPSEPITLEVLREQVSSPESYVLNHSDDFAVYRAVYPESQEFLLRYCLCEAIDQDQNSLERKAHWTFTGYGHDISEILKRWTSYNIQRAPSAKYFRERRA